MPRRSYQEGCLAAHALDLIGDRWAILVLRELMLGPKRFGLIRAGVPGIATNVLSQRLAELEADGLLVHEAPLYRLTEAGLQARDVLDALCRWGLRQPGHDPTRFISPTGLMLSMGFLCRPAAEPIEAAIQLGAESFSACAGPDGFVARPDPAPRAGLGFAGTTNALAALVYGKRPIASLVRSGQLRFEGDPARGQAFVDRFLLAP